MSHLRLLAPLFFRFLIVTKRDCERRRGDCFAGLPNSPYDHLPSGKNGRKNVVLFVTLIQSCLKCWVAVMSAKNHNRQRRKRQSVTAKRESRKRQRS